MQECINAYSLVAVDRLSGLCVCTKMFVHVCVSVSI